MTSETEKPTTGLVEDQKPDVSHEEAIKVAPIEQEATQEAYHVHLSWRSWV